MPIKFRCNYCRQFLGISRAQAGGVVDCPTCGRSIRVPLLDGTVQPLPTPELNMQDAHLARALDELAQLGDALDEPRPAAKSVMSGFGSDDSDEGAEDENEIPQPIPEPIPIEVPIAPTPIRIDPPLQAVDPPVEAAASTEPAGEPSAMGAMSSLAREHSLLAELASLAPPPPLEGPQRESAPVAPVSSPPKAIRPKSSLGLRAFTVLVVFVAGMFVERFARLLESWSAKTSSAPQANLPEEAAVGDLTGRISFKTPEGESRPDRGARVIVLPIERVSEVKLPVTGFRPADTEADAKVVDAALKALGGAMATADDDGRYRLNLPAGSYRVLVLSKFQARDETEAIDADITKLLATLFDKPADLLGRVKHHLAPLKVKGTGDEWDHAF